MEILLGALGAVAFTVLVYGLFWFAWKMERRG